VYQADMLYKIAPFSLEEALLLKERITVFSMLQLQDLSIETIRILQHKKINAIAYDFLKDEQQNYSVVNSIREIEGKVAISVAAEMMSSQHGGKGILLGGIAGVNPSEIIILGAGISGTAAAQVALSLGSVVKVFDHDVSKLRDLHRFLGTSVCSSVFHPLSLSKALLSADAVIGCLRYEEEFRHFLVLEEAVQTMKKGAVIVDLAMNQGGCFETSVCTSLNKPYFMRHGVLHCCVPNLSARVARTSSMALSDVLSELMLSVNQDGGIVNSIKKNQGFSSGVYLYNGILTNAFIGSHLGLLSNDIRLLLAAF
jgi:alanine dehydrogenase